MARLDILSLTNTLADSASGSGYVVLGSAGELRRRGHSVRVYDPGDYELLPRLNRGRRYKQALGMAARAAREVREAPPDVVELWGGEGWLAALRLRRRGRRFLVVARSNGLEAHCTEYFDAARRTGELERGRWFRPEQTRLFERGVRAADALITVSEFDREFALDRGYLDPARILALPNPLPDTYLGLPVPDCRKRTLGFCGSWIPRKGVRLIQEALPVVLREFPDWRLLLVGVGAGFRPDDHFPADVSSRIDVVPHADRDRELVSIYGSMGLLLMPSIYESFGLAATEAMACGTPVMGPSTGILASLEADREFLLLRDRRPESLVSALRRTIMDPELRVAVGLAGRRRVQSLRWDGAVDRLESAYGRWLAELRDGESPPDHP